MKKRIYSPDSRIREPWVLLREMGRDLLDSRDLAWRLLVRDIRATYRQSFLGMAWMFLPPLLTAAVWSFLNSQKILSPGEMSLPYPVFVLTGTTIFTFFRACIGGPLSAFEANRGVIAKVQMPPEAIVLSAFGRAVVNSSLQILPIVIVLIAFGVSISWTAIFIPAALVSVAGLGLLIGISLLPWGSLYGDVNKGLSMALQFLMYLSPVVYAPPKGPLWDVINSLNPIAPLLVTIRELLVGDPLSMPIQFAVVTVMTFALLGFAWITVRLSLPILIERMSA